VMSSPLMFEEGASAFESLITINKHVITTNVKVHL